MDMVRPEQIHPVLDRVEPVSRSDAGVLRDKGRLRRVHLLTPPIRNIGVDKDKLAVRAEYLHQLVQLPGGHKVIGAEAEHNDRPQPAGVREPAHDGQARRHLPVRLSVDVDAGHGVGESKSTGRHD
jgi:hypothetical protein